VRFQHRGDLRRNWCHVVVAKWYGVLERHAGRLHPHAERRVARLTKRLELERHTRLTAAVADSWVIAANELKVAPGNPNEFLHHLAGLNGVEDRAAILVLRVPGAVGGDLERRVYSGNQGLEPPCLRLPSQRTAREQGRRVPLCGTDDCLR